MIKLNAKHQHHMTNFGPKIKQVNSHEDIRNVRIKMKLTRIISTNPERVKILLNSQKHIKKTL